MGEKCYQSQAGQQCLIVDTHRLKSMVPVELCPNESKYLAISSPSEAVSASIHMIHNRSGMHMD